MGFFGSMFGGSSSSSALQDFKSSVRAASTANVVIASELENGDVLDGVTLATGDRVLLKNQTTGSENGIYVVVASGAASRATDFDVSSEVTAGVIIPVSEGTANADKVFMLSTNDPIVLGTTSLSFVQVGTTTLPGGSNTQIQFNDSGAFGGDADLTWDKTNNVLSIASSLLLYGDAIEYPQSSTPSNPPSNKWKAYFKSDGRFYKLNSSGTETEIGQVEGSSAAQAAFWGTFSANAIATWGGSGTRTLSGSSVGFGKFGSTVYLQSYNVLFAGETITDQPIYSLSDWSSTHHPLFLASRYRGDVVTSAALSSGDTIFEIRGTGSTNTANGSAIAGEIFLKSTEAYSPTTTGSKFLFKTTANTTTGTADALTIDHNGDLILNRASSALKFGSDGGGNIGAPASGRPDFAYVKTAVVVDSSSTTEPGLTITNSGGTNHPSILINSDNSEQRISLAYYIPNSAGPLFQMRKARGTSHTSPGAISSGDDLGFIAASGYGSEGAFGDQYGIIWIATEAHAAGAHGSKLRFQSIPNGTNARVNQWQLDQNGDLGSVGTGALSVGTTNAVASALLEVSSTTRGFLPPRMTTTQRDAISSPALGLMIYNTTTNKLNVYTGSWEQITSA